MFTIDPDIQMWVTMAIIGAAIIFYAWERLPLEVTSLGVIAALLVFFHLFPIAAPATPNLLDPRTLLAGFADPALIAIISLLIMGQGMVQTGALEYPAKLLVGPSGPPPGVVLIFSLVFVAIASAFLNNTPVVVIFIPIMSAIAEKMGWSPSSVMMPLSFVAIMGGMTTLIGSSTNLLVAGSLSALEGGKIEFFDFTIPGILLASVGLIYSLLVAPRLLTDRASLAGALVGGIDGKQFIVEIDVLPDSPLVGEAPVAGMFPSLPHITVRMIQRGERAMLPPFEDIELQPGDAVIVAATRKALMEALAHKPKLLGAALTDFEEGDEEKDTSPSSPGDQVLAEVVVAPASRMVGRTLALTGFRNQTGCIVLGIQRRSHMMRSSINDIRLEAGDTLLVIGKREAVRGLRDNRDVLLIEWSRRELPAVHHARRAAFIFLGVIALAATGVMPIAVAALCGAAAMVAGDCLNVRQAARAVDRRIVLIVAAALAMGVSLEATGGAEYLALSLIAALEGAGTAVFLSAFFLLVAVLTNLLSNNATAVLFTPIAYRLAEGLGADPMVFVFAVIFAANSSFATPMGYQTNLLVMGPGHYGFSDFIKVGAPLIILIWLTFSFFAPWYYGL